MADYKEMYLSLMRETEKAIDILIDAQRRCEDMYIGTTDREPVVLVSSPPAQSPPPAARRDGDKNC